MGVGGRVEKLWGGGVEGERGRGKGSVEGSRRRK